MNIDDRLNPDVEDDDEKVEVTITDDDDSDDGEGGSGAPAEKDVGDERLSADQRDDDAKDGETEEEKRERRKRERKAKNERRKAYAERDQLLIESTTRANQDLAARVVELEKKLYEQQAGTVDGQINYVRSEMQRAQRELAKAVTDGDGERVVQLQNWMGQATRHLDGLEARRKQPAPVAPQTTPDPVTSEYANEFMQRHKWYDPRNSDPHSAIVSRIDKEVAGDGFNPRTPAYWHELERRMRLNLPGHLLDGGAGDDDEQPAPRGRRAPPVAGRPDAAASKGKTITIPRELRQAMEDAGSWDDPKRRDKVIKNYLQAQKENRA